MASATSHGQSQPARSEGSVSPGEKSFVSPTDNIPAATIIRPGTAGARRRRVAAKTIRVRVKEHSKFDASQPCVICGRMPTEAHHIRFAQPRALGRKVSDEYTVPVGSLHHRDLHDYGDEASWWAAVRFEVPTRRTTTRHSDLGLFPGRRLAEAYARAAAILGDEQYASRL